jgi:acyl-CoA dehydrogenase
MAEPGVRGYRHAVSAILAGVPAPADGPAVWRALGRGGALARLYAGPSGRLIPDRLDTLLTELDARYPIGPVLSVCVQAATALPLLGAELAELAGDRAADLPREVHAAAVGGEAVLALAATDGGGSGSDLLAATTTAELTDTTVVVNGGKRWITNASTAAYALVLARHRAARHFTSFVWILVPGDAPGVGVTPAGADLFAGSGLGHLRFDGVVLGREHVLGRPGRAMAGFARHIGNERLASGLWARALCRRVLADTYHWLRTWPLNGRPAWDNDAIRERFARCLVALDQLDAACTRHAADLEGPGAMLAGMLVKVSAAETVRLVLGECVQLRGGDAFADGGLAALSAATAMWGLAGGATGAMLAGIAGHAAELLGADGDRA